MQQPLFLQTSKILLILFGLITAAHGAVPQAPILQLTVDNNTVTANWDAVAGASGYKLSYAPYPAGTPVNSLDVGNATRMSKTLPQGGAYYIAVQAYNGEGASGYSNIESFEAFAPIHVSTSGDDGNTGRDPSAPKRSIQAAINTAGQYDQVLVSQGQYDENLIILLKSARIEGGYNDDFSQRDPTLFATIVSGPAINRPILSALSLNRKIVDISGITITSPYPIPTPNTQGVVVDNIDLRMRDCLVTGISGEWAGGIEILNSEALIERCQISNNYSYNSGGGVSIENSIVSIKDCDVSGNSANANGDGGGLGIWDNSIVTMDNCTINDNAATGNAGGGISIGQAFLVITNSDISNNNVSNYGGGLNFWESYAIIDNCTVNNNTVGVNGGGISFGPFDFAPGYLMANTASLNNTPNNVSGAFTDGGGNNF